MPSDKSWQLLCQEGDSSPLFGASSSQLNDSVYLIGGVSSDNNPPTVLRVRHLDLLTLSWSSVQVNANRVINRAYHASAAMGGSIYVFGGVASSLQDGSELFLDEMIVCTPNSLEGLQCVRIQSELSQRKGLSASTVGGEDLLQKIVLFGGASAEGRCDSSDLLVFIEEGSDEKPDDKVLKQVGCAGPSPKPRSHHSSAVAGRRQEYLVISAGWDGAVAFNDMWVCDLTNLLSGRSLEPVEVVPAKGKKGKDETPLPELYTWHQIVFSSPMDSRFMHGCCATCSGTLDDGLNIFVFGGMAAEGPLDPECHEECVVTFDGHECSAQLESSSHKEKFSQNVNARYAFSTSTVYENGVPVAAVVFGGKFGNCESKCFILDEESSISKLLEQHHAQATENDEEAVSNRRLINYPNGDVYDGEIFVDVEDKNPADERNDDDTNHVRHGHGVMKYADGAIYEGQWQYNCQAGQGKYVTPDEDTIYEGNFCENEFDGSGQLSMKNGNVVYNGNFKKGKFEGHGVLLDKSQKTIYEGEFCDGLKHGKGELRNVDISNDESKDPGTLVYSGSWKCDRPEGYGTIILAGGHVYTGSIVNGHPEGTGKCKYADGSEYSGTWKSGRRNGTGEYISRNLDTYKGKWVGDVRCGKGTWVSCRGDEYSGIWDKNYPHGDGCMTYRLRENESSNLKEKKYVGGWNHGKRHGFGEVLYADGSMKKGSWRSNEYDEALADYEIGQ